MQHSGVSLLTAVVVAIVAYLLGVAHAVTRRAYRDWKDTQALAGARGAAFWATIRQLAQVGAVAVVLAVVLLAWVVRDVRDDGNTPLVPARASPSATPTRR